MKLPIMTTNAPASESQTKRALEALLTGTRNGSIEWKRANTGNWSTEFRDLLCIVELYQSESDGIHPARSYGRLCILGEDDKFVDTAAAIDLYKAIEAVNTADQLDPWLDALEVQVGKQLAP